MELGLLTDGISPFVIGGMQKHSFYLAKVLPKIGVKVTLIHCVPYNKVLPNNEIVYNKLGISGDNRKNLEIIGLHFPKQKNSLPGHYLRESYEYSIKIFEIIKDNLNDFDFIYAKGFTAWKLIEEKEKGLICPPIGVKFHGLNMFQKAVNIKAKLQHYMFRPFVKYNMINADYNFSYGGKITDITREIGVKSSKILEFPTGIANDWFEQNYFNQSIRTFLFIGRYERLKGIEELNKAILSINDDFDFKFYFVGPIPYNKMIISQKVEYLGKIMDAEKLKEIYKSVDIVVCPSYSEGMPNVIMEGMAQARPSIATDVGAVNIMVNNENGWLLNSSKVNEIKNALIAAVNISDSQLLEKKKLCYQIARDNFKWENIAQNISNRLQEIVK